MKKIVITGGTGFIGKSLAHHLQAYGYEPVLVARNRPKPDLPFEFAQWDAIQPGEWAKHLEGALAVVNLAGRTVDCIKTPENCDVILRSRVDSTKAVGQALKQAANPPKIWIQMSTAHIYGDPPSQVCTEDATYGYGLAPTVAIAWEKAHEEHLPDGTRSVLLRTSFVIGKNGGALGTLKFISRLGLGGKVGHGKQGISWIHEWDMNEIIRQAIEQDQFHGAYICSAPNPISQSMFMKILRKQLKMPIGLPAPALLVRVGAPLFFRTDPELILYGRYVIPERLINQGFNFKYSELEAALFDLIR